MKHKLFFILSIALLLLLFVSCTQDTDGGDGIFEQVVSQSSSSKYRIRQFLGNEPKGAGKDDYYFIEEEGLYRNNSNIVPGNFSSGYMSDDLKKVYLLKSNGKIFEYDISGTSATGKEQEFSPKGIFSQLLESGFAVEVKNDGSKKIWDLKDKTECTCPEPVKSRFCFAYGSEDSILVECYKEKGYVYGNSYYLYKRGGSSFTSISNFSGRMLGAFQQAGDVFYVVYTRNDSNQYNDVYKISLSEGTASRVGTINYLSKDGYQNPSCYVPSKDMVIIRSTSKYELIKNAATTSPSLDDTYTDFASGIYVSDMELMNIKEKNGEDGKYIFAFFKYGLFEVSPKSGATPKQIKL